MNDVTVILTPIDADRFKLFQKYYDLFSILENSKILDIQFGKCTINIAFGQVQNVVKEESVYHK
jgi:hypothetical protein